MRGGLTLNRRWPRPRAESSARDQNNRVCLWVKISAVCTSRDSHSQLQIRLGLSGFACVSVRWLCGNRKGVRLSLSLTCKLHRFGVFVGEKETDIEKSSAIELIRRGFDELRSSMCCLPLVYVISLFTSSSTPLFCAELALYTFPNLLSSSSGS